MSEKPKYYGMGHPSSHPADYKVLEAKAKFSEVVERGMLGEAVVIYKGNKPVAKVIAISAPGLRKIGSAKGQIKLAADFDAPLEDFDGYQ